MTKKARKTGKRCLALFMTVLMLMSAWVFVAPTKAQAAAGNYTISVDGICENDAYASGMEVIVYYKPNNGTGTETHKTIYSRSDNFTWDGTGNDDRWNVSIEGFPTKVEYKVKKRYGVGTLTLYCIIYVNGVNLGETNHEWYNTSGWKTWTWTASSGQYPAMSSLTISGATSHTIPKTGASNLTSEYDVSAAYDQYGVQWYTEPTSTFWINASQPANASEAAHDTATGCSINSTGTLTVTSSAQIAGTTNSKTVYVSCVNGSAWGTMAVTLNDPKYNVKFYDGNGAQFGSTQQVYYGSNASAPSGTPTKNPDATSHYTFSSWGTYTNITADTNVNASFNSATHTYGSWSADTATCTAGGSHSRTCSVCSYKQTESTSPLGHNWVTTVNADHLKSGATCTSPAIYYKWCSRCGANHPTDTFTNGSALGHDFTGAYQNVSDGRHNRKCSRCNEYGIGSGTSATVNGTEACSGGTANCVDKAVCSKCSTAYGNVDRANHKSTENRAAVANSCETGGYTAGVYCTACNQWVSGHDVVPAKGHDYTGAIHSLGNGTHNWACKNGCGTYGKVENGTQVKDGTVSCDATYGNWSDDTATCLEGGSHSRTCSECGYTQTEATSQLGHNWVTTVSADHLISAADCETPATYHKWCSRCGANHPSETFTNGAALGHNYTGAAHNLGNGTHNWACKNGCGTYGKVEGETQVKNGVVSCDATYGAWSDDTATCTTAGSQSRTCSECGYVQTRTTDPLNHHWVETADEDHKVSDATCEVAKTYHKWCDRCGDDHPTDTFTVGDPLGHDYTGTARDNGDGTHSWLCQNGCGTYGKVEGDTQVKNGKTGHTYGDFYDVQDATCTEEGSKTHKCTVCNKVETLPIPTNDNHDWDDGEITTPANCHDKGVKTFTCSRCGATKTEDVATNPNNHKNLVRTAPVDNGCENDGNIEYWFCDGCNKYYSDAAATQQITQADTVLAATGHDFSADASRIHSLNDGTHNWVCANGCGACGKVENNTQVKDGTVSCDATYGNWTTDTATCTAGGSHSRTCSACGYVQTAETPELGHRWVTTVSAAHKISDADCEHAAVYHKWCDRCGIDHETDTFTDGDPLDHDFTDTPHDLGNGTHNWKCSRCNEYGIVENGEQVKNGSVSCADTYSDWETVVQNDCVNGGSEKRTCSVCGHVETKDTNPLGHLFTKQTVSDATLYQVATCNSKARYWYSCDRCGEIERDDNHTFESGEFDPNNHNYVFERTVDPWCETQGYDIYRCSRCGDTQNRNFVDPLNHTWGAWTSISSTQHKRVCERDANHSETENHDMQLIETIAPTCEAIGYEVWTCSVCGYSEHREEQAALGHDFTGDVRDNDNGTHSFKCTHEGCGKYGVGTGASAEINGTETCQYGAWSEDTATCLVGGSHTKVCDVCGHSVTEATPPLGHKFDAEIVSADTLAVRATCTEQAEYYYTCSREGCGEIQRDTTKTFKAGDPLGHDWETEPPVYLWENNNTRMTATLYCGNDKNHSISETVTAAKVVTKEPTCTEKGVATYTATFANDPTQNEYNYTTPFTTQTTTSDVNTIPHKTTTHVDAVAPTCSDPGNIEYWICEVCGGYFEDVGGYYPTTAEDVVIPIDPDAHDYGAWTPNGESGHTKVCSHNDEHNQSEAHTWANIVSAATKATNDGPICENGEAYYKTCSVCGYISTTEIFTTQASGHKLVYVPAVAPTCTDDGTIAHYQCGACGKYFSDAAAENELTAAEIVDPATGHDYTGAYIDNGDGTHSRLCVNGCGTYGATAEHAFTVENAGAAYAVNGQTADCTHEAAYYYSCVCGACENDADHTFTSGGSLGHVLGEIAAVTATCAADGHDAYWHCSRCGKFFTDNTAATETDPADHVISHSTVAHTWPADWTETLAPTCTDIGKEERTCSVCGLTETRDIPKLQHSFTGDVVSYNDGTHAHKCVYGCGLVGTVENCETHKTQISSTAANCTTMGDTTYECTVCHYQWTVVGTGYGPHDGTFTHHDAVAATCTTAGNIEYWTCDLCGVMFSDEDHTVEVTNVSTPALNHEGIASVEQVNATCTEPGVKAHAECPLCGKMFSDVTASHEVNADDLAIPAKGHDFHGAIQDKDASEHWYKCTRCDVYGGAEAHSYTRALAIDDAKKADATCTASATYYYSCACGRINNAEGADTFTVGSPTGHAYNSVKAGSWTWTKVGDTYTAKVTLVCANDPNHETERDAVVTFTTDAPNCTTAGTRHYTATVTLDDGSTDSDTKDETVPVVGHSLVATAAKDATCEEAGYEAYWTCSVCGKLFNNADGAAEHEISTPVVINALGHDWGTPTYTWSKDGDTYICIAEEVCSRNDQHIKNETATATAQVTQDPTCIAMGKTTYTATFNDADFEQQTQTLTDVAKVPHTPTKTEAVEATCTVEGHDAYWTCSSCHKIFSDENCDHEIASVTTALDPDNHKTLVHHAKVDATCLANGNIEYWHCNDCGLDLVYNDAGKLVATTDTVIPAGPDYHRFTTHVSAREATCTQQGNVEYWTCAVCGKHFDGNTAAANELTDVSVAANGHTFEHTAAVPATCTVDGNKEYWYCTVCHQYFLTGATNASDTLAVPFSDTIDPKTGHTSASVAAIEVGCETDGRKAFTYCSVCDTILTLEGVDVSLNGWTKTDNEEIYKIPHTGHAYGDPTWVWADDYSSATATRVCANDASHTLTETDNDIATVVVPKTHTTDGKTTYTAEVTFAFDNKTYTDVVEVVDAASGHHTTKVNPKDATCEEAGNREYWICEDEGCGKLFVDEAALVETTLDAVTIPALGHNWVNPTWTWTMNGDYYTGATLTFTCANDDSHTYAPTVTFTSERTEPDCTTAGKIVYTATATTEAKDNLTVETYTDTKEVALTKTGHALTKTDANPASCTEAGNIDYWTCSTCGKIFSDENAQYEITADATVIAALDHTYDYANANYAWAADHSSCTATATCVRCTATDTETKDSTYEVKIAATCEAKGLGIYTVDFDNVNFATQTFTEFIAAKGHGEAVPHDALAATCEEAGYEAYWTCPDCGKLFKAAELTAANEIANPIPVAATGHSWDYEHVAYAWNTTNEPYTCEATVTCLNDSDHTKTLTASIAADTVAATCTADGHTTYTATFPGDTNIPSDTKTATIAALGHDFSASVDRANAVDDTHHNYKCVRCDAYGIGSGATAEVDGSVACTFPNEWYVSANETCTEDGSEWHQCEFCDNTETRTRVASGHKVFTVEAQAATCVAIGNKAYTYCERCGLLLTVDGEDVEAQNIKFNSAAAIALYKTEDQLAHDLTATAAVSATCETDGNIAYWTCSRCGKIFSVANPTADTAAITLADTVIPATKHDFTGAVRNNGDETHSKQCTKCEAWGIMVNGTPVKDGKEACYGGTADCENAATCVVCGETYGTKLGHNYILQNWTWTGYESAVAHYVCTNDTNHTKDVTATVVKTDATVTCTAAGQNTYVATATFTDDGRTYTDTDTKTEVVNATGHDWDFENAEYSWDANLNCTVTLHCLNDDDHVYTEVGKNTTTTTPATCEGTGNVKYVASFTISNTLTSEHNETLAALGHNWGSPAWTWTETADGYDVEAAFVCKRNDEHTRTLTATVTKDETAPTCENEGRILYTASVTLDGRTYKDTKLTVQDAIGHDWQAPVFTWTGNSTDGYTAATALFACGNDSTHNQTLNCALTYVTDDATCTSGGTVTYTATVTFNGTSYTDTKTATVDELGHNYEFAGFNWSGDDATGYTATVANFVCANDNSHTETAPATVTTETVAAICEADGKITYTAKATFGGVEYTDTRVVVLPMLHHNWGDITYTWVKDGDQYKVTALRVCANNPSEHQQTETVTTTSEITESSGCESEGTLVYTAVFHTPFATQTKEEAVAVTGHTLVHTAYQDSTCTEVGNIEYWRCSVCDKIFTDELASTTSYIGTDLAATVISAKGHDFVMSGDGMVAIDNEDGTHSFKCSRCDVYGAVIDGVQTAGGKVAHSYGEWIIVKEPTCKDPGEQKHICEICGNVETAPVGYAAHVLYGIRAKSATCTTGGNKAYYFCQVCGKLFTDATGTTETTLEEVTLPATGHNFSGAIRNNGDGTHSYLCVNGCHTYGGAEAHVFDQQIATREYLRNYANCTEPSAYYKSCKCGEKGTETFTVGEAAGHIMISFPAQAATCLQAGHTPYTECSRCHYREGYEVIGATGHGAYYYDEAKSGALSNGTMKWEAYSCENGCGDYYLKTTITSLDANGNRVPNVNVRITGANGTNITGTTDNNGDLRIGTDYKTSLHPGTYTVYLEYVKDGGNYNTHGTITIGNDGKVSGSFGTLTPYGGNASGSIGGKPTNEFRCSMCDTYEHNKDNKVFGWVISIIHSIVHAISRITSR